MPWSFVGAVDGTVLTYDPDEAARRPGDALGRRGRDLHDRRARDGEEPGLEAPVLRLGLHDRRGRTAGARPAGGQTLGDPDFVNIVPSDQFLDRYVFFTDYTFPETTLTFVRRKTTRAASSP